MFKITEFSNLTGMTIRTLQYYDEIGLLVPNREINGHRTYSCEDLIIANEIILLKEVGFKLDDIVAYTSNKDDMNISNSLLMQKRILLDKLNNIKKQVESIDILIRTSENNLSIEDNAIKKIFIDNNPIKDQITSIWNLDLKKNKYSQYLKNQSSSMKFDYYFKRLVKLQKCEVHEKRVQAEIVDFVSYLKSIYKDSFDDHSIKNFAKVYIENKEAKTYLVQYGQNFNVFLYEALIYYSENI